MRKQRIHNEYFRTVSLGNRKSCPSCTAKLNGESIWSWGEYVYGKWRTVDYFCRHCFNQNVQGRLIDHSDDCGCAFQLIGYGGEQLPDWLTLDRTPYLIAEERKAG